MPGIKQVKPNYENMAMAAGYFYSEYDPITHFEYKMPFLSDGITPDLEELNRDYDITTHKGGPKIIAYQKAVEHHFNFEQILPKTNTNFVTFYRPQYIQENNEYEPAIPLDYDFHFDQITETNFELMKDTILDELPIYSATLFTIEQYGTLDKEFSEMNYSQLNSLLERWDQILVDHPEFIDATNKNKHIYECALYCKVKRPKKEGSSELIDPYNFRRILRLVNKVFTFNIPVEEGWYKYDKVKKKWELIIFKEESDNNG